MMHLVWLGVDQSQLGDGACIVKNSAPCTITAVSGNGESHLPWCHVHEYFTYARGAVTHCDGTFLGEARNIVIRTQHLLAVVCTHNICCLPGIESIVCHATSARWEVRNCKIPFVSMEDETTLFLGTTMFQMVLMEVGTTLFLGTTMFLLVVIISATHPPFLIPTGESHLPWCYVHE